jgi:hypothetical protein
MLKNIETRIILFLFVGCIAACDHKSKTAAAGPENFNKEKWQTVDGGEYPFRDQMIHNLLYTDTIRRLKRDSILYLLGEPTRIDSNFLFYRVKQQTYGLLTMHTKTLVIKFAKDSSVAWIKIHE